MEVISFHAKTRRTPSCCTSSLYCWAVIDGVAEVSSCSGGTLTSLLESSTEETTVVLLDWVEAGAGDEGGGEEEKGLIQLRTLKYPPDFCSRFGVLDEVDGVEVVRLFWLDILDKLDRL